MNGTNDKLLHLNGSRAYVLDGGFGSLLERLGYPVEVGMEHEKISHSTNIRSFLPSYLEAHPMERWCIVGSSRSRREGPRRVCFIEHLYDASDEHLGSSMLAQKSSKRTRTTSQFRS